MHALHLHIHEQKALGLWCGQYMVASKKFNRIFNNAKSLRSHLWRLNKHLIMLMGLAQSD